MKVRRYFAVAVPVAAAAVLAASGTAHAGIVSGSPIYTSTASEGGNAVAGWMGFSPSVVNFTHTESYIGSSGDSSWENLPVSSQLGPAGTSYSNVTPSATSPVHITGGVGNQLCDQKSGDALQIGIVNESGTPDTFDVVEAVGTFNASGTQKALNSKGDVCDNGLLGQAPGSEAVILKVLLTDVKANDTVQEGVLYDLHNPYGFSMRGRNAHPGAGHVTFYATDLSNVVNNSYDILFVPSYLGRGIVTDEVDAGVVSDATKAPALTGVAVPAPNGNGLVSSAPNELVRFAHVKASGNSIAPGGHEISGDTFQANTAWNVYPVASTADGTSTGALYLDPSLFAEDNFYVAGGIGLVG